MNTVGQNGKGLRAELQAGNGRLDLPQERGALYLGDVYDNSLCRIVAMFVGGDERDIRHYKVPYDDKSELDLANTIQDGTTHLGLRGFDLWRNLLRGTSLR